MSSEPSRKPENQDKTARLDVRVSGEQKELIRQASSLVGVSMSAFVLAHAYEAAQRTIEHATHVELGEEASLQVAEALTRPARPLPELVDLFRE